MADRFDVAVGSKVREMRILRGYSQKMVADRMGITFQQVQKYERGSNRLAASRLIQIAEILDVPIQHFFEHIPEANRGKVANGEGEDLDAEAVRVARDWVSIDDPVLRNAARAFLRDINLVREPALGNGGHCANDRGSPSRPDR